MQNKRKGTFLFTHEWKVLKYTDGPCASSDTAKRQVDVLI